MCVYCPEPGDELTKNVLIDLTLQVNYSVGIESIGYHRLHGSIMGCSLTVTRAGVAGWECECQITYN